MTPPNGRPCEFYQLPNVLKRKVREASAVITPATIARAEDAVEDIKAFHTDWLRDDVLALQETFSAYCQRPTERTLARLYRASHDLRGQASLFEHPHIFRIANLLCSLIETFADATNPPLALMSLHVDIIRVVLRQNVKKANDPTAVELIQVLEDQDRRIVEVTKGGTLRFGPH